MNYLDIVERDLNKLESISLGEIFHYLEPYWGKVKLVDENTAYILRQIHAITIRKVFEYMLQDNKGEFGKQHWWEMCEEDLKNLRKGEEAAGFLTDSSTGCNIHSMVEYMEYLRTKLVRRYLL